jgi:glycosyltransferase involved in cell wall biosynthesis
MKKLKIAVYAICKNEEQFVEKFLTSCKDADGIFIADTGSTDDTNNKFWEVAEKLEIQSKLHYQTVHIKPWRFDDARNANLAMIPTDYDMCICLDLDEILTEGWRQELDKFMTENPDCKRIRYNYIWNWIDGKPGVSYWGNKIHARDGYRWRMPVHEVLKRDPRALGPENEKFLVSPNFEIHHHADISKSRSQYLPLLKLAVEEEPNNDREAHYYARELYIYEKYEEAIPEFLRHLSLPTATWKEERAASMRFLGDCYWAIGNFPLAKEWHIKSTQECPHTREPWVTLAQTCRALRDWQGCKDACEKALAITERGNSYINQPIAWSDWPETMLKEALANLSN